MFRKERHAEILRLLDRQGRVEVEDLAAHYGVSCDSIRKDLQYLDKHGLCKRVYGGALKSADVSALNIFYIPTLIPNFPPTLTVSVQNNASTSLYLHLTMYFHLSHKQRRTQTRKIILTPTDGQLQSALTWK